MTHTAKRAMLARGGIGIAALSMLVLAGCGTETQTAGFADSEEPAQTTEGPTQASEDAAPALTTDPGFVYEDISKDVTVTGTIRPEQGEIITPSGTLTVNEVQEVTAVAAEEVGLDPAPGTDGEAAEYGAAQGEAFRIVDVTYTPHSQAPGDDVATSDLSLVAGGAQQHLSALEDQQDHRILVSAPDDGSTRLVVSSEGHDQYVDVLTGERVDDEVAAAYYLPTARQELHHTFAIDDDAFPTKTHSSPAEDVTIDYSFQIVTATLTAWTADDGWASPGQAWLEVDWNYEVTAEHPVIPGSIEKLDAALAIDVDGEVTEETIHVEDETRDAKGDQTASLAVPVDTTEVGLSVSGDIEVGMLYGSGLEMAGEKAAEFSGDELTVSFAAR